MIFKRRHLLIPHCQVHAGTRSTMHTSVYVLYACGTTASDPYSCISQNLRTRAPYTRDTPHTCAHNTQRNATFFSLSFYLLLSCFVTIVVLSSPERYYYYSPFTFLPFFLFFFFHFFPFSFSLLFPSSYHFTLLYFALLSLRANVVAEIRQTRRFHASRFLLLINRTTIYLR